MPALTVPQQPDWNNNVYVLATTRMFVMIGMAYLIKSLYNLVPSIWGTRSAPIAAVVADGIDLQDIASDTPVMVPGTVGTGPDLEATLPLGIRPPQPSYDPQGHAERPRANARVQDEGMEHSGSLPSAVVTQDQGAGVRNGAHYVEESMDITVDVTD